MLRVGMFGGSFDPPHLGHVAAARFFADALALDKLLVVPAGQAPLKSVASTPAQDRLELCRRSFPFEVSEIELARNGESYTIDTLRDIAGHYPEAELFLLIGTDQLAQFTQWRQWQEILRLCTVCALQRDDTPLATSLPVRLLSGFVPVDTSATQLRGMLAQGKDASAYLAPEAYDYIRTRGLYTRPVLPPKRLHHSQCVAEAADTLALKYGAKREKARFAGLWHDCAKHLTLAEQTALCAKAGMPLRQIDLDISPVCHAFAGAAYLAVHLGITDEEILSAVRWHTTGRAGMTLMEKILRVADLISADRNYPDVDVVRNLAAKDLDAASRYIAGYFIKNLDVIHPDTLAWHNEMKENTPCNH